MNVKCEYDNNVNSGMNLFRELDQMHIHDDDHCTLFTFILHIHNIFFLIFVTRFV